MEYENTRVPELKSLARDRWLRNYSRMRKSELVALLQNNGSPPSRIENPSPPTQTWDPTQQEMDIFEQQEMGKSGPRVKNKLNEWYD